LRRIDAGADTVDMAHALMAEKSAGTGAVADRISAVQARLAAAQAVLGIERPAPAAGRGPQVDAATLVVLGVLATSLEDEAAAYRDATEAVLAFREALSAYVRMLDAFAESNDHLVELAGTRTVTIRPEVVALTGLTIRREAEALRDALALLP